eukprot:18727-Heterococcus_DN1.PRE.6
METDNMSCSASVKQSAVCSDTGYSTLYSPRIAATASMSSITITDVSEYALITEYSSCVLQSTALLQCTSSSTSLSPK